MAENVDAPFGIELFDQHLKEGLLVGKERLVFGWWGEGGEEEDQTACGFTIAGLSVLVEFVALFVKLCFLPRYLPYHVVISFGLEEA